MNHQRRLVLVLGDQLSLNLSSLAGAPPKDCTVLMAEVGAEVGYAPHHAKKLALLFSAMRHHAERLRAAGYRVDYVTLDDPANAQSLPDELERAYARLGPFEEVVVTRPGEWRVQETLDALRDSGALPLRWEEDDRFFASRFDDEDLQVFGRFVSYVERALDHAMSHRENKQTRNFDDETGLPNASYLDKRLGEEIARAAGRDDALAVCICKLENRAELTAEAGSAHVGRVIRLLSDALQTHLREFDVLARLDRDEFVVLMPEPGRTPGERVFELARAVADVVSKDENLNQPVRIGLAFGYGVHPADGDEREALLAHARDPRIRMV